jgi:hypothetical protein
VQGQFDVASPVSVLDLSLKISDLHESLMDKSKWAQLRNLAIGGPVPEGRC